MRFIITLTILLTALDSYSQSLPFKQDSIFSTVLNENRIIQVYLPPGYKPDLSNTYDVMYVLDGKDHITFLSHIQQYGVREKIQPPSIIVGIFNTNRTRDLTPTEVKDMGPSGGATKFLSFLKTELVPYIEKTYPARGEKILHGHSLGGLFAMYAMLSEPTLFSSFIIVEPSFWWDKPYSSNMALEKLHTLSGMKKTVYLAGCDEDKIGMGISRMDSVLKLKAPKDMLYKVVTYQGETHSTVKLKSAYDGLRLIYQGYQTHNINLEVHPTSGTVLKDKPYKVYNLNRHPNMRFTTDGTVPMLSSPKPEPVSTFSGPLILNMKSFTTQGKYDKLSKGEFTLGELSSPLKTSANLIPGGLSYSYFEGQWTRVPNFRKLKPLKTGIADKDFDLTKLPSETNFACLFEGAMEIKQEGYYTFLLLSDDASKLYVGKKLLIDHEGVRSKRTPKSYMVPLKTGFYPIRIEYIHRDGRADARVKYMIPGSSLPEHIPLEAQFHL